MALRRRLCVLAALSALLVACSPRADQSAAPTTSAKSPTMAAVAPPPGAGPVTPACGDGPALLASMTTRDKLAQLLMVGVKDAADARAVVTDHHVGGIFIGSWTDLSMLSDGSLTEIAASAGPLPLEVSVDEEGGRVSRLASLIGSQPSPRVLAKTHTPGEVYNISSGEGVAIGELASRILAMAGTDATLESDPSLVRPVDVPILVGDPSRLQDTTGWSAEHSLDTIIEDVIRATAH